MYGREYAGQTLNFEASGGLLNSSLVMQDRETDSYWSIMTGDAVGGELEGTVLQELPLGEKAQWKDWVARHPDTKVLSIRGREDVAGDPYQRYYDDPTGFRGQRARDDRLATKAPIYALQLGGEKYAVPHEAIEGGAVLRLEDGSALFLYRPAGSSLFRSTDAYRSSAGFEERGDGWVETGSGARFVPESGELEGAEIERPGGFDTFWYTWSLTHPDTEVLK